LAPLASAVYVVPFLTMTHPPSDDLRSVGIAIPACVMVGEVLARSTRGMREAQQAQEVSAAALAHAAVTDDLTQLGNRRHGERLLENLRPGDALLLLDLDRFKSVNDTFGHAEGDRVLACLGDYLRGQLRGAEHVARYGGEEFIIVLPGSGQGAVDVAERLVAGWRLTNPVATLSIGVAEHRPGTRSALTFGEADRALYEAKTAGRDRVSCATADPGPTLRLVVGETSDIDRAAR
jgi:diguanylate cyclase (GGDEF)-like protein